MEGNTKDRIKDQIVSREEMDQLLSTAERLSDELARAIGAKANFVIVQMLLIVVILGVGFLMAFEIQPWLGAIFTFQKSDIFFVMGISTTLLALLFRYWTGKTSGRLSARVSLLRSSLLGVMNMVEEARGLYDQKLSPIERATLYLRLRTISYSEEMLKGTKSRFSPWFKSPFKVGTQESKASKSQSSASRYESSAVPPRSYPVSDNPL